MEIFACGIGNPGVFFPGLWNRIRNSAQGIRDPFYADKELRITSSYMRRRKTFCYCLCNIKVMCSFLSVYVAREH